METSAQNNLMEYTVGQEPWRCSAFGLLAAEFGLAPENLPAFQEMVARDARRWLIVRRLYGMMPVLPPPSADLADMRQWERAELMKLLGLTRPQLKAELDAVRGGWQKQLAAREAQPVETGQLPALELAPVDEHGQQDLTFGDDELLKKYHFDHLGLKEVGERAWFAAEVRSLHKILEEPMVKGLAHQCLVAQLEVQRLEAFLNNPTAGSETVVRGAEWQKLSKLKTDLAGRYETGMLKIAELCPWATELAGKMAFNAVMSEVSLGIQRYKARGDRTLIDGMFTRGEVRVECRRSKQMPEPRYRADIVVFVQMAKQHLFDVDWQPDYEEAELKRLQANWRAAEVAAQTVARVPLPDLEDTGPAGEYVDSFKPEA